MITFLNQRNINIRYLKTIGINSINSMHTFLGSELVGFVIKYKYD